MTLPPPPTGCCALGRRPDAPAIDAALLGGQESLSSVAARLGLSKGALHRHRAGCLGALGTPPATVPGTGPAGQEHAGTPQGTSPYLLAGPNPGDDAMTAPRQLITAEVERQALALRIKGKSYTDIGSALSVDPDTAMDAVERVLLRTRGKADEMAETARALEVRRCDAIIEAFWERATDPAMATVMVPADTESGAKAYDGQDKAADRLLKAMERKAKLQGLDAPTGAKVQVNVLQTPGVEGLLKAVLGALADEPVARAKVVAAVRLAQMSGRAGE